MASRTGNKHKLYYLTSGTWGSPTTWTEITKAKNVRLNGESAEADVSDRGSTWRKRKKGLRDGGVDTTLNYDPANTPCMDMQALWLADDGSTEIFAVADGDITVNGTRYFKFEGEVFTFGRDEPLEEAVTIEMAIRPTDSSNIPLFVTVGS